MIFAPLLTSLLVTAATLAAPNGQVTRSRHAGDRRRTRPLQRLDTAGASLASNVSQVQYSSNWAGAVWNSPAGTFTKVVGTFTVPTPSAPDGSASAWVGIDGDSCSNAILQTGVDFNIQGGQVSYDAWYEWFPDYAYNFNININAGDTIRLTVNADSTVSGTATIENLTNGQNVSKDLSSNSPLCGQDAEWIVEDYESGGSLVPFTNFGTVDFTDASASGTGNPVSPDGAKMFDIQQNGQVLTSVSENSNGVTIQHV